MKKTIKIIGLFIILIIIGMIFTSKTVKAVTIYGYNYEKKSVYEGATVSFSPAVLTANKNVYCIARDQSNWLGSKKFKVSSLKTEGDPINAYILAQDKFSSTVGAYSENKQHGSISQNAYWSRLGQPYSNTNAVQTLIAKAKDYATYINNFTFEKVNTNYKITNLTNGKTVVGPFKIKYNKTTYFGGLDSTRVNGEKNSKNVDLTKGTDYYFSSDAKGNKKIDEPKSNENFYIVIEANKNITKVNYINFGTTKKTLTVQYYQLTRQENAGQNLKVILKNWNSENKNLKITINESLDTSLDFTLNKVDYNNNAISNTTFSIYFNNIKQLTVNGTVVNTGKDKISINLSNGVKAVSEQDDDTDNITITGLKTDSSGKIKITDIVPTSLTGRVIITITEETAATGHQELPAPLYLQCDYETNNWVIKLRNDDRDNSKLKGYYELSNSNSNVTVKLKNDATMQNILISKNVANAKFAAKITNVSELKINKKFFVNEKPELDEEYKASYKSDGNNYIIKSNNTDNAIRIKNLITKEITSIQSSSGNNYKGILFTNVKLSHGDTRIRVSLRETEAPNGYEKIKGLISVVFEKDQKGFNLYGYSIEEDENEKELVSQEEFDVEKDVFNFKKETTTVNNKEINKLSRAGDATTYSCIIRIRDKRITPVELDLTKTDVNGTGLKGATFKVAFMQDGNVIKTLTKTASNSSNIQFDAVTPNTIEKELMVVITETEAPSGFAKLENPITIILKYNNGKWEKKSVTDKESAASNIAISTKDSKTTVKMNIKNATKVIQNIILNKKDITGNNVVAGATFRAYFNNITYVKINGKTYKLENIIKENNKINRNGTEFYTKTANGLTFLVPVGDNDRIYIEGLKTDKSGQIKIDEIEAKANVDTVYVTFKETEAASGYDKLPNEARLLLRYNNKNSNKWEMFIREEQKALEKFDENDAGNKNELSNNYYSVDGNKLTLTLKDDLKIDEFTILKTDLDNSKLSGAEFKVTLTNVKTAKLGSSTYKENNGKIEISNAKTDKNGNITLKDLVIKDATKQVTVTIEETKVPSSDYKKLEGKINLTITKNGNSYKATATKDSTISDNEFTASNVTVNGNKIALNIKNIASITLSGQVWLDGQQGEKVVANPNGKIDEKEEGIDGVKVHLFSVKDNSVVKETTTSDGGKYEFKDIPKTAEGYKVQFEYNGILYDPVGIKGDSKAAEGDNARGDLKSNFKTINNEGANGSKYGPYNATYFKNYVDGSQPAGAAIKAYTEVYKNTTSNINCGLTEKYFDLAVGTDLSKATVKINGKATDYTYKQVLDGELKKDLQAFQGVSANTEGIKYNLYLYQSDYNYRISDYKTDTNGGIANKVNPDDSKKNNYDTKQELEVYVTYSVVLKNQSMHKATVTKFEYTYDEDFEPYNIASTEKYEIKTDKENRKITFTSKDNGLSVNGPDYRNQIDLTFKVKNDDKGVILKENYTNTVEIMEYTTYEGGLIDIDSVPGNGTNNNEDDYDKAPALNIAIDTNKVRTIGGTVFEDKDKDGQKNNDDTTVNDVIVQLIELKTIDEKYYEYIWQETRSGSDGTYQFKDFIPGNYIIRFIYGDGSTYGITTNVQNYNGQDYKSTIDNSYKEEWYDPAKYNGNSTARDNEARRLEVMAYSTTIDKDKGDKINNKEKEMLDATWMCAETSKVNVAVDTEGYSNMNFGLALRPQTKLTLEKHITGLKITPQGTGVQPIVDAKVVNGEIQGITTGLAKMDSTRSERGFWKVETDIEELAQGATVELEYTYTIKNNSEDDYLSDTLIETYKDSTSEEYATYLSNIVANGQGDLKNQLKGKTNNYDKYLGQYYYTGIKGNTDSAVLSKVNTIEDYLNNNLKLVEETNMNFEKSNSGAVEKNVYDADGNEKKENIETVIRNKETTGTLANDKVDSSRTVKLTTTLSSSNKEISYPTYIGEIVEYTNAAGRKDMEATPGNLSYVHSEDNAKTMENSNEHDEFWGETLIVSKPTGENKNIAIQITIIVISSLAVIGVGIILIKKYALKK